MPTAIDQPAIQPARESKAVARNHHDSQRAPTTTAAADEGQETGTKQKSSEGTTIQQYGHWGEYNIYTHIVNPSSRRKIPFLCCQHIFRIIYFSILFPENYVKL